MSDAAPGTIETVSRALRVLEMLNRRPLTTLEQLHGDTGLPKSTLVRLLRALMADGYAVQVSRAAGYRLGARVLALGSGYQPRDRLADVAQPLMDRFTRVHKWPLYLATPEDHAMRVRCTSAPLSAVAPDHQSAYHYRFSMLVSAFGKAYLASCPRAERALLLAAIVDTPDVQDGQLRGKAEAAALLLGIAKQGFATTGLIAGDRGRGLAVPLRVGRRVVGAISMRHYRSTVSEAAAVQRYLDPLRELADAIGTALGQAGDASRLTAGATAGTPRERTSKKQETGEA